jgi:hypothetical protein
MFHSDSRTPQQRFRAVIDALVFCVHLNIFNPASFR